MENAKTSPIPETINEKAQDGDEESLTPSEARNFRTCVGKAMYLNHHRPDIQHSVNTLSRSMRNPTVIAMRRLKKLTRYLLGTSEVYQELGTVCRKVWHRESFQCLDDDQTVSRSNQHV